MGLRTKAHMFYGVNIEIQEGVEWETLDEDTAGGIAMIAYGSDGDSLYAVAIAGSIVTANLDEVAPTVEVTSSVDWPPAIRAFCQKHEIDAAEAPAWRLAVERF